MNYYLIKLKFSTPVHFGSGDNAQSLSNSTIGCCADTFFSALCHAALASGGESRLHSLANAVNDDRLVFSDLLPYSGDRLYLPKPMIAPDLRPDADPLQRKRMKKVTHIACRDMDTYMACLRGKADFIINTPSFGTAETIDKAAIIPGDDAEPYSVEVFRFSEAAECGLFVILGYDTEELKDEIIKLTTLCGLSGLGGKTSAGYGKFAIDDELYLDEGVDEDTDYLIKALNATDVNRYMLLSASLPADDEIEHALEGASYGVIRRSGFIQTVKEPFCKKRTQYFLTAGNVVAHRFNGALYDVGSPAYPALRYGKPLFLGVIE